MLAEAIVPISDYYGLTASPIWMMWVQLIIAAGVVYGPKVMIAMATPPPADSPFRPQFAQ